MKRGRLRLPGRAVLALLLAAPILAGSPALGSGRQLRRPHPRAVLLVAGSYDGTIHFLDARTFRALGRPLNIIPEGALPVDPAQRAIYPALVQNRGEVNYAQEVVASPDGRTVYVSRGYLGDVAAFDVVTHAELWRRQMPASSLRADHLALTPDGRRLFVSALPGTKVYALDPLDGRVKGSLDAGDWPHVLEVSADGRYLYSGSLGNQLLPYGHDSSTHQFTIADARTLKVLHAYRFGVGVRPFALLPHSHQVLLQLSYLNGFVVFDLASGKVIRTVNLPLRGDASKLRPQDYPNQAAHHGIAVAADGRTACDAGTISNYVALVALTRPGAAKIVSVGEAPAEALTSFDGRYCFVISRGPTALHRQHVPNLNGDTLSVISYAARREIVRIRVGVHPQAQTEAWIPEQVLRAGGYVR